MKARMAPIVREILHSRQEDLLPGENLEEITDKLTESFEEGEREKYITFKSQNYVILNKPPTNVFAKKRKETRTNNSTEQYYQNKYHSETNIFSRIIDRIKEYW